jgi:hypothetical protein
METLAPLSPAALHRTCDPALLPFTTTAELTDGEAFLGQDRALTALRFGVGMSRTGRGCSGCPRGKARACARRWTSWSSS